MTATLPAVTAGGVAERMTRIEDLLAQVAALPDEAARSSAEELVREVLELHRAGLARLLELARTEGGTAAGPLLNALAADESVRCLLLVHDLHPIALEARVRQALEAVRPMMAAHRGGVELLGVADGVVRLRLEGNCNGCPSSTATMRNAVEEAIHRLAPDVTDIDVEGVAEAPARVDIDCLKPLPIAGFAPGTGTAVAS